MSSLSQFFGGGSVPIGGLVVMPDAHINPSIGGREYLRAGRIKTYAADYADVIVDAPQLRVFGIDATSLKAAAVDSRRTTYYRIGTNYVSVSANLNNGIYYSTDLVNWSNVAGTGTPSLHCGKRFAVNGASYLVVPVAANTAHRYSANGSTFSAVGGTFTTHPISSAVAYGNSWWVALHDLAGTAGGRSTINNANPSGTWTVAASPSLGGTSGAAGVKAIAFGGASNWFVAAGGSASATAGKLATCTDPSATWTDRTSGSGITFGATSIITDLIFDGTYFVAVVDALYVWRTTDPTGVWTYMGVLPIDTFATNYIGATNVGYAFTQLSTDGAGKIVAACGGAGGRYLALYSGDSGATWSPFQVYAKSAHSATTDYNAVSHANSKWIANYSGAIKANIDLGGDLAGTPNYVGIQKQAAQGFYVRIK